MARPLDGISVLDLTRLMPGYVSTLLGDLGAETLKIEEPRSGDYLRELGPQVAGTGYAFLMLHRNKRGLALDLKHEAGARIFRDLVGRADVLIENFRPGVMHRFGLDYSALAAINPRLIYCAITGYGQTGPYRDLPGHDVNYAALAGVYGLQRAGAEMAELPLPVADFESAQRAAMSILAALLARERGGGGCFIDIAMADGLPAWLLQPMAEFFATGELPEPARYRRPTDPRWVGQVPGYGLYRAGDGFLALGCAEPKFWASLCACVDRPDLTGMRDADEAGARVADTALRAILVHRPRDTWMRLFRERDVPCMTVADLRDVVANEQLRARGLFFETEHPTAGRIRQLATAFGLGAEPRQAPAPGLGEHNHAVLRELGYSDSEIAHLKVDGAI